MGLVETRLTAGSLQSTAYGPDVDEMRIVENLPRAKTPHETEVLQRQVVATVRAKDALVDVLSGLTKVETGLAEGAWG